jgi:hypothetical protein
MFWSSSSQPAAGIRDFQSGTSDTIVTALAGTVYRAALTSTGAAFTVGMSTAPYAQLYLWKNGTLTTKALNSTSSFAAAGNYIIYTVDQNTSSLYRMDVTTGAEILISGSVGNSEDGVAENGDVAYWSMSYDIFRYRAGDTLRVTSESDANWNVYPVTDGINIVFRRTTPCCSGSSAPEEEIWLFDGSSLSMLSPARASSVAPNYDYAVTGGWTAFTKVDASAHTQVWTRSPTGALRSVSALGTSSVVRALGSDGSVIFDAGHDRYFAGPSSAPVRVGSSAGNVIWRDGRFVVLIGNSAFTVNP